MKRSAAAVLGLALALALALAGCRTPAPPPAGDAAAHAIASVFDGTGGTWVDLTHAFSEKTIYWPTDTLGFVHEKLAYGRTDGGWFYSSYRYEAAEHGGTHLDAPIHFGEGRQTNDAIPLSRLVGPAVVVDVSAGATPDGLVAVDDFTRWEAAHGPIPAGAIVLARTGWDRRYGDRAAYLGTAKTGSAAVPELHFPGLAPEAARWLVDERRIAAFGLDTPSVDRGQSKEFGAHVLLAAADVPGFENVANLDRVPPRGAFVVALPMKIEGGSGGPLRIVAFVPASSAAPAESSSATSRGR